MNFLSIAAVVKFYLHSIYNSDKCVTISSKKLLSTANLYLDPNQ